MRAGVARAGSGTRMARQANRWAGRLVAATLVLTCALGMLPVTRDASGQVVATPTAAIAVAAQVPPTVFPITTTTHAAVGASLTPTPVPFTTPPPTDSIGTTATASAQATAPIPTGTTGAPLTTTTALLPSSTPTAAGTVVGTATAAGTAVGTATSVASTSPTFSVTATLTTVTATPLGAQPPVGTSDVLSRNGGSSASTGLMRPRAVTSNLPTSFASITAGGSHTCALTTAGAAWCWGANGSGQLGDGTTLGSAVPVAVTGGITFASINAGNGFTCGLTTDGSAYCWGANGNGQFGNHTQTYASTPTAAAGGLKFSSITTGDGHVCGITTDAAYCWGANPWGQVPGSTNGSMPVDALDPVRLTINGGFSTIRTVSAGRVHTCGLDNNNVAFCWGNNQDGALGTGDASWGTRTPSMVGTPGGQPWSFRAIASGRSHTCAISIDGKMYCWGNNYSGALGDTTTTSRYVPTAVQNYDTFVKLSLGADHSCATKSNGSLWCWGSNAAGQLGDGTLTNATSPVLVSGLSTVRSFAAGISHTCAVDADGRAACWGSAESGKVGDGLDSVRPTPVKVSGTTPFTSLSAGGWHTCGRTSSGTTSCWGWNAKGQLGDGTTTDKASPALVGAGGSTTQFTKVSGGLYHTCALTSAGAAWCWGSGQYGGLGDGRSGTGTMASTPVAVTGGQIFTTISAGYESACATDASSGVWCWGAKNGAMPWQPGIATTPERAMIGGSIVAVASGYYTAQVRYCTPGYCNGIDPPITYPNITPASLVAGGNHFCGLTTASDAWCWGDNTNGQLGNGTTSTNGASGPVQVAGGQKFASLAAGGSFTCGLTSDGTAYCWGWGGYGTLGNGATDSYKLTPYPVATILKFTALTAGAEHACGIAKDSATYCWGNAYHGQVGDGTVGYRLAPTLVMGQTPPTPTPTVPSAFSSVAAGSGHACGLSASGVAWCWGAGASGQIGDGANTSRATPVAVWNFPAFRALALGGMHTCGIAIASGTYCWGDNRSGQLGNGASGQGMKHLNQSSPVAVVSDVSFTSLAAGWVHTCGLTAQGDAYCWGDRYSGQVGDGLVSGYERERTSPVKVSGGLKFTSITAGGNHTCGLTASGGAYCWGWNTSGQVGNGSTTNQYTPVAVSGSVTFRSLAAHGYHTCGIAMTGDAYCWGRNDSGQLGDGSQVNRQTPTKVVTTSTFVSLALGEGFTCGLTGDGVRICWGANTAGQFGDATTESVVTPRTLTGLRRFSSLIAGDAFACGQSGQSGWSCWGDNTDGQLGDGTSASKPQPTRVQSSQSFASISVGGNHTCALTTAAEAWCWGANESGQIGDDSTIARTTPVRVGGGVSFASISAGANHTCGVTAAGQAYCWGDNQSSQLGDGTTVKARAFPVPVAGGERFAIISAYANQTCGITLDGTTRCWGSSSTWKWSGATGTTTSTTATYGLDHACNVTTCWGGDHVAYVGLLGNGVGWPTGQQATISSPAPFASVDAGSMHTCGLTALANIYCWGGNDHGELGDGTMRDRWTPVKVSGTTTFSTVSAGAYRTCALSSSGDAWCWGRGVNGSNGDGTLGYRTVPALVSSQVDQTPIAIRSVRIANVRDTSFTVSWVTDVATTGAIRWGPDDGTTPTTVVADTRGATVTSTVHYVTVNGTKAATRYRFDVVSDVTSDTNAGAHYLVTTGPTLSLTGSDQTRGTIARADGTAPDGVVVHVRATGTTGNSAPLAFLITAANAKEWAANLGNLRTATLDATYPVTDTTQIIVTADGGADGTVGATTTVATARTGSLSLALGTPTSMPLQSGWTLVALRVTPSPALTASGVCSLTNLDAPGSVVEVVRWSAGAWESHRCGLPPNDFTLEPGAGYFVRTTVAATWPTWGAAVTTPVTRALITGWNLVGAAVTSPTPSTAPAICTTLNGAVAGSALEVVQWIDAGWAAHTCGTSVNQFTMQAGQGYFVKMAKTGSIALSGASPMASASLRR